jgi:hypothetical protein
LAMYLLSSLSSIWIIPLTLEKEKLFILAVWYVTEIWKNSSMTNLKLLWLNSNFLIKVHMYCYHCLWIKFRGRCIFLMTIAQIFWPYTIPNLFAVPI